MNPLRLGADFGEKQTMKVSCNFNPLMFFCQNDLVMGVICHG